MRLDSRSVTPYQPANGNYIYALAIALLAFLLTWAYSNFVSEYFSYSGFAFNPTPLKAIEAFVAVFILTLLIPKRLSKPSDLLLNILFLITYLPFAVLYALADENRFTFYTVTAALIGLTSACLNSYRLKIPKMKINSYYRKLSFLATLSIALVIANAALRGRLSLNFNLADIYWYRSEVSSLNSEIFGYLNSWAPKVFIPALFSFALLKRRLFSTFIIFGASIFLFGLLQHKAIIFYPFIVSFVILFFDKNKDLWTVPLILSLAVSTCLAAALISDNIVLASMLIRRVFFVPALLTFKYYEFFLVNPHVWWSNSFLSVFVDYPYDLPTGKLIGNYLETDANANNTFLATGYMHAGLLGMALYTSIVILLLNLVDSFSYNLLPPQVAVAMVVVPFFSLFNSADLTTAILTHGVALSMLILYFLANSMHLRPGALNN